MLSVMYGKRLSYDQFFHALDKDREQVISAWIQDVNQFRDSEVRDLQNDRSFLNAVCTLLALADRYEGTDDKAAAFLCEIRPLLEQMSPLSPAPGISVVLLRPFSRNDRGILAVRKSGTRMIFQVSNPQKRI